MRNSSAITRDLNGSNCSHAQELNSLKVNLILQDRSGVDKSLKIAAALAEGFSAVGAAAVQCVRGLLPNRVRDALGRQVIERLHSR